MLSAALDFVQRGGVTAILLAIIFFLIWQVIGGLLQKKWVPGWLYQESQDEVKALKETIKGYESEMREGIKALLERGRR